MESYKQKYYNFFKSSSYSQCFLFKADDTYVTWFRDIGKGFVIGHFSNHVNPNQHFQTFVKP